MVAVQMYSLVLIYLITQFHRKAFNQRQQGEVINKAGEQMLKEAILKRELIYILCIYNIYNSRIFSN